MRRTECAMKREKLMKYIKTLGALALALTALIAVGGSSASATELTCNGVRCPVGTLLHGESAGAIVLHPPFGEIKCNRATSEGTVTSAGSATTTPTGKTSFTEYKECNATVTVLKAGSGETHTAGASNNGNGLITSSGSEVTVGFFGTHCIFSTNNTQVGEFTGSNNTGGTARFDIKATIPRTGGSSGVFCGSTAQMTGSVIMNSPDNLVVH
jgi:hypothetical protein